MEGQRNDFMQGKTQEASWGWECGGNTGLSGALKAKHAKIKAQKEHNQHFPSIKWIKVIEVPCQRDEVNMMSLSMEPQA